MEPTLGSLPKLVLLLKSVESNLQIRKYSTIQKGWNIRSSTVSMKTTPIPMVTSLRRVLSMTMSPRYAVEEDRSSDAMSRIIAVIASQRPMSEAERGKFILYAPRICSRTSRVSSSGSSSLFSIVTIFPVDFAVAHTRALTIGQPRE